MCLVTTEPNSQRKKIHRREREKISIHLVTLTSQKIRKTRVGQARLFIQARVHVTPRIACEKVRVN